MKILFLLLFTTITATNTRGQLTKKNWLVGGVGNFSTSKQNLPSSTDKYSSTTFSVLPNIGYFIKDKFALGIGLGVSFTQSKSSSLKTSVTSYNLGPFARYYLLNTENATNIFLQGKFSYGVNRFNNFGNSISHSSNVLYSFSGGPVIYFNSSVALEFVLGWDYNKNIEDKSSVSSFKIGIGFQIHLEK